MNLMKSMELDDEEKLDASCPIPMPDRPQWPYGLRICLTEAEFKKLGMDGNDAEIDGMFHGHFMARVTSVSKTDSPDGTKIRVEAQIESLGIESEDDENDDE